MAFRERYVACRVSRIPMLTVLLEDHDKLSGIMKQHFNIILETKDVTFKGWNWGVTDFQGWAIYNLEVVVLSK